MSNYILLGADDVVRFDHTSFFREFPYQTFKIQDFNHHITKLSFVGDLNDWNRDHDWVKEKKQWIQAGMPGEVLILNTGIPQWQKGTFKLRFTLEFYADEPLGETSTNTSSPLDDLRKRI